jgi:hypothetical protein
MISLKSLMAAGDALFSGVVIPGNPDWQALHDSTPDDTMPGEDDDTDDLVEIPDDQSADDQSAGDRLAAAIAGAMESAMAEAFMGEESTKSKA